MREYFYRLATDQENTPFAKIIKVFLLWLSFFYGLAVKAVSWGYKNNLIKSCTLPRKVISVGNITLGGAGKTPFVEFLVGVLKEKNIKSVILSRGYGAHNPDGASDEVLLLRGSLAGVPVIVGRDRVASGLQALKDHAANVVVLDDGFQHWRLKRDLDIVLIDATQPFGNGELIPRGILREPLSSLRRAHVFVLTKTNWAKDTFKLKQHLSKINPPCPIVEAIHEPIGLSDLLDNNQPRPLSLLNGKSACAFCGIADPKSFERILQDLGVEVARIFSFMDHHRYTQQDTAAIIQFCKASHLEWVVTTQKDAAKLSPFLNDFRRPLNLLSVQIKIRILRGNDELFTRISSLWDR